MLLSLGFRDYSSASRASHANFAETSNAVVVSQGCVVETSRQHGNFLQQLAFLIAVVEGPCKLQKHICTHHACEALRMLSVL